MGRKQPCLYLITNTIFKTIKIISCVALTYSLNLPHLPRPFLALVKDADGRASGASGESDGTDCEGYSLVSEYWGNCLSIYDPEGNKIHIGMVWCGSQAHGVMFSLW